LHHFDPRKIRSIWTYRKTGAHDTPDFGGTASQLGQN
jgi:hypothetical protein